MEFSQISPLVRFVHTFNMNKQSFYETVTPLDSRLFFVKDGVGRIEVDEQVYELKKDSALLVNSGVSYRLLTPECSVSFIVVNFDYTKDACDKNFPVTPVLKKHFKPSMLLAHVEFEGAPRLSKVLYVEKIPELQSKLSLLLKEFSFQLMFFKEKLSGILTSCLIDMVRVVNLGFSVDKDDTNAQIIKYIQENYQKPLTNKSIAKEFNYHPNYISQLIKKTTGLPLHKYLIHVRLQKAVSLLNNTSLSINDVALECGFCDLAYFSGYFKRAFKVSPSNFRNV